jgi:hypothetical protein
MDQSQLPKRREFHTPQKMENVQHDIGRPTMGQPLSETFGESLESTSVHICTYFIYTDGDTCSPQALCLTHSTY